MLFRSLRPLAGRALVAGTASALALILFNAAQPSLSTTHKVHPGTLKTVKVHLTPVPTPSPPSARVVAPTPCGQPGAARLRVGYAPPPGACARRRVGEGRPGDADAVGAGFGG